MLLTVSTTGTPERPATGLGFLPHKHPDKAQALPTSYGTAHVLYPEATPGRCTAAPLLEVDPVALVRRAGGGGARGRGPGTVPAQYVDDRPYAASSLFAVARATCSPARWLGGAPPAPNSPRASCRCASRSRRCPRRTAPVRCAGCSSRRAGR